MDRAEEVLLSRHREAARHYRWSVKQLQQKHEDGDHNAFLSFLAHVVAPSRKRCYNVFSEGCNRYGSQNSGR